jgi:hypothetical protein
MFGNNAIQIERVHQLVLHHKICPKTDSPDAYNKDINYVVENDGFKLTVPMLTRQQHLNPLQASQHKS